MARDEYKQTDQDLIHLYFIFQNWYKHMSQFESFNYKDSIQEILEKCEEKIKSAKKYYYEVSKFQDLDKMINDIFDDKTRSEMTNKKEIEESPSVIKRIVTVLSNPILITMFFIACFVYFIGLISSIKNVNFNKF